jgi:DNA-binding transcriptional MerR regulator
MPTLRRAIATTPVAQLAPLNRILVLKDLGFNLDQVRDILSSNISAAELRNMLLLRRNDVEQTPSVESQRLHRIETRIAQLESEGTLSADDVVVRSEPMRQLLSLKRIVPSFNAARELILELRTHARPLLPKGRPSTLIAIAHSPQFEQDEIDVEFGYVLEDGFNANPLEEGSVLTLRELGSVERMAACVRVASLKTRILLLPRSVASSRRAATHWLGRAGRFFSNHPTSTACTKL